MIGEIPGYQRYTTTDLALGVSGQPVVVYSAVVRGSGTATVVSLRNGTTDGADASDTIDAGINTTVVRDYGAKGMYFPSGCFVDVDANTSFASFNFQQVQTRTP